MIGCIPDDEEGRKVFAQLMAQYEKVNTLGVTYRLHKNIVTEHYFDFENTIIQELQIQVDSINTSGARDWAAIKALCKAGLKGFGHLKLCLEQQVMSDHEPLDSYESPTSEKAFFDLIGIKLII
ncbi:hypothetical protein [Legionella feeleii]|uniref:Uncharacterized protein n=1 Tax=Legionella feeleii TaxID=453 RepID=A0A378IUB3_9GAMM|nr:hypothetical protein [Legionella feeleii]STX38797.1 Uncharacterised protein [Legionella feeleii]